MTAAERIVEPRTLTTYTLALNFLPVTQLIAGAALVVTQATSVVGAIMCALTWLYLVPPLVCRLAILLFGSPSGRALTHRDRAYKIWWFTWQWQVVFNRLPWLEEILRLVPGLYALWIALWGGRASALAYWGPGARITDRPLVIVEAGAVIGMDAGLAGHAGTLAPDGTYRVDVMAPRVGAGAIMGVRSGLGPGAALAAGVLLPAGRMIKPFTRWDGTTRRSLMTEEHDGGCRDHH